MRHGNRISRRFIPNQALYRCCLTSPTLMNRSFSTLSLALSTTVASLAVAAVPALAGPTLFDTLSSGIFSFDATTTLEFTFLEAHGKYKSTFGILDVAAATKTAIFAETKAYNPGSDANPGNEANDWLNDGYVTPWEASFTFEAGKQYQLAYWGVEHNETASDVVINEGSYEFLTTGPNYVGPAATKTIDFDGLILGWEDGWEEENGREGDYNDLIVGVKKATPEPTAMLGLGAIALLGAARRRRSAS